METQDCRASPGTPANLGSNPLPPLPLGPGSVQIWTATSVKFCMAGNSPGGNAPWSRQATGPESCISPENRMNPWSTAEAIGAQAKEGQTVQAGRPRGARPRRQCRVQLWLVRGDEITMRVTRHHRPIVSLLALALVLGAGFLPAAAQSGSEAVVCVGSETRTLQTNPIRRVYTEDMEIVYRIGVDIGQRDQMERNLGSELGSYPEVWCAWSDPGDDHAVIISYTGVIRQDLTVDPEDPRFQAFTVGFGEDFDEAETQATTISQRFSSQNDGSGYEVLLRETWSVAEGAVAEGQWAGVRPAGRADLYGKLLSRLVLDGAG